jgi:hypothetical protein
VFNIERYCSLADRSSPRDEVPRVLALNPEGDSALELGDEGESELVPHETSTSELATATLSVTSRLRHSCSTPSRAMAIFYIPLESPPSISPVVVRPSFHNT